MFDVDIYEWLSDYTKVIPTGRSDEVRIDCPECGDGDTKLYVNINKHLFHCKKCNFGEKVRDVSILLSSVSGKSVSAIHKELQNFVNPTDKANLTEKLKSVLFNDDVSLSPYMPVAAVELLGIATFKGIVGSAVGDYAASRGLSELDIQRLQLRAAYSIFKFIGPFLLFPIIYDDIPVCWQGRRTVESEPKYVSHDDIANWLWPLHGTYLTSIIHKRAVVLTEGVFDALGFWKIGIPALCTFGKKISEKQIKLLKDLGVFVIKIAWDADALPEIEKAALRLRAMFNVHVVDLSVRPNNNSDDKIDPGSVLRDPSLENWLLDRLNSAIDVRDSSFFFWRLSRNIK